MAEPSPRLQRKHYLLSRANLEKIEALSRQLDVSAAEVVRRAVDAYDPIDPRQQELESVVDAMGEAVREAQQATDAALAQAREARITMQRQREDIRARAREEAGRHPELLEALNELLGGQTSR